MTDPRKQLVHPRTKKKTPCVCICNYFCSNEYGFLFDGDRTVYRWREIQHDQPRHRVPVTPYKDD